MALRTLPIRAARALRTVVGPLDEFHLVDSQPAGTIRYLRELMIPDDIRGGPPEDTFTFALDDVRAGWLYVVLGDRRGEQRLAVSYLTPALDHLLAALRALTDGQRHTRVSWDGEPTEYRWLFTRSSDADVHVRILRLTSAMADLPDSLGCCVLEARPTLHALVGSVTVAARSLLTRFGEDGYARHWIANPFPTEHLLALEQWHAAATPRQSN